MVLGFGGGGGEGVRTVCPGGDSGLEPAGRKGANPTGYSVKCFVRLGVTSEALGQGAAVLGEQVERILIPLAGSDCFKRVTLLPGTKDRDRKTGLSVDKTEMASQLSILPIWLESVHLSSSADR